MNSAISSTVVVGHSIGALGQRQDSGFNLSNPSIGLSFIP